MFVKALQVANVVAAAKVAQDGFEDLGRAYALSCSAKGLATRPRRTNTSP